MRIGHRALGLGILGRPLLRAGRAPRQLIVVVEEVVEVSVVPLRRLVGPRAFQPAGDRVSALTRSEGVRPADALRLDRATFGLGADQIGIAGTMAFAKRVTAD